MSHANRNSVGAGPSRRSFLKSTAATGAMALGGGYLLSACGDDEATSTPQNKSPYEKADIDWRAAEGEQLNVAVIEASYFANLFELKSQFEDLTGIKVTNETLPPTEIRAEVIRDFTTGAGTYHVSATDPMYYPLYVANKWVEDLTPYLEDEKLTNPEWFAYDDVLAKWRESTQVDGVTYGIPYDGEATVQVYRKDLFDENGLSPAEDFDTFRSNADAIHDPDNRMWGAALRGIAGAGQNMYIYPSLFRAWGGEWFDESGSPTVNSDAAIAALDYYVKLENDFAPKDVVNWNWPEIADAFAQGTVGSYIDAHSSAAVLLDKTKSTVVDKLGFARWPEGPAGKRVTSIWNWSFPINASISDKQKKAAWLFIQWATSEETQARTSYKFGGDVKRSGVNRQSIWENEEYQKAIDAGEGFVDASLTSLQDDTDIDWRPRVPQWPEIGDEMAVLVQEALTGQKTPEEAMNAANNKIEQILS